MAISQNVGKVSALPLTADVRPLCQKRTARAYRSGAAVRTPANNFIDCKAVPLPKIGKAHSACCQIDTIIAIVVPKKLKVASTSLPRPILTVDRMDEFLAWPSGGRPWAISDLLCGLLCFHFSLSRCRRGRLTHRNVP